MQYHSECFSAGLSSLGSPPCLPVCGTWLSSAVELQARGLQGQTGGWPDAMVTQRLAGDRTERKRQGPIPGEGQYTRETPNGFPHLRDPGCSLVQEAQGPLGEREDPSAFPVHRHPSPRRLVSVSLPGCKMAVLWRVQEPQIPTCSCWP